jgi:hypothetical protein
VVVGVDDDRDAVRPGADDRAGPRELEPPQAAVPVDLTQGAERLAELSQQSLHPQRIAQFAFLRQEGEDSREDDRLVIDFQEPERRTTVSEKERLAEERERMRMAKEDEGEDVEGHQFAREDEGDDVEGHQLAGRMAREEGEDDDDVEGHQLNA